MQQPESKEQNKLLKKAKESASNFHKEVRRSIATAIVAAFGFIIALSWRDVIIEWVGKIKKLTDIQGKFVEALIITGLAVIGIYLVTKFIAETDPPKIA